jgi:hypothetical protein
VTVSPSRLPLDGTAKVRAIAREGGSVGKGSVTFQANIGSLITPVTVSLDEFGTASADFTCDQLPAGCAVDEATITALWARTPPLKAEATLRFTSSSGGAGGGASGGSGGGSGAQPWAAYPNAMFFDGADGGFIFQGQMLITEGTFSATATNSSASFSVRPDSGSALTSWSLTFEAPQPPLTVGRYEMAARFASRDDAGTPGLSVTGNGRGCNSVSGSFEVLDFSSTDAGVVATITFEQFCERRTSNRLRGWIRYGH